MLKFWMECIKEFFTTPPAKHLQMFRQDCKYALRMMWKNPGFTSIALLTLGLGVGVNTAIFSVVHGIILRPLPYSHGEDLVVLRQQSLKSGINDMMFSVPEINDYRTQNKTLSDLVEYHAMRFMLLSGATAERVRTGVVSWDYFNFYGIHPILGRTFLPSDEQHDAPPVLLLSYDYWQRAQNGDPHIVGKTFQMNDKIHTVIGVLPPVPQYPRQNDVYMTTSSCPFRSSAALINGRDRRMMFLFGRLKSGVSLQSAITDLQTISHRLESEYNGTYPADFSLALMSLEDVLTRGARPTLWLLLAAAAFVLMIACANVANFMLARLSQREQELLLRTALGAGRTRLLRQLITESAILGLLAGFLGVLLALSSQRLLVEFAARLSPRAREITIDAPVLIFSLLAAVITSILAGSALAFSSRQNLASGLREGTAQASSSIGRRRVRSILIVAQVAFSFILLIGAGLMLRSFVKLQNVDPGFVTHKVLTMAIDLNWSKYTTPQVQRNAARTILQNVSSLPGVQAAAISSSFPLDPDAIVRGSGAFNNRFQIEGRPVREGEVPPTSGARAITADYFKSLGIPLVHGRMFTANDKEDAPAVAIINQALAKNRWGKDDPLNKRISFDGGISWIMIIGVVGNTKEFGLAENSSEQIYLPMDQVPGVGSLLVRTSVDPLAQENKIREAVMRFDPQTAITNLETLEQARNDTLASPRVLTNLMGLFAALALVIAATGIGGILALSVNQRIKEIGIRLALGAKPSHVRFMVIRQGMVLVFLGLLFGVVGSFIVTRPLSALLFEVSPTDPLTLVGVCVLLAVVALVACYIPARRATAVNPLVALRYDG
jgi:putative ABC transport system permease protein